MADRRNAARELILRSPRVLLKDTGAVGRPLHLERDDVAFVYHQKYEVLLE